MTSISVIIPCFEAGDYLRESVTSALAQRDANADVEVIVVDDMSQDASTRNALVDMAALDRVRVTENRGPRGSAAARNTGIALARGEWIAFLDADDWWPENSLALRLNAHRLHPQVGWIGGDFIELRRDGSFEASGRFQRNLDSYPDLRPAYATALHPIVLKRPIDAFLQQAPANTIVTLVKKELLEGCGGFDTALLRQQDMHLFLRLAVRHDYLYVPQVVAYYRLHESNSTRSLTHTQKWRITALQALLGVPEFFPHRTALEQCIHQLHLGNSYEFRTSREFGKAALAALAAVRTHPGSWPAWKSLAAAALRQG